MKFKICKVDICTYFQWYINDLVIWISWVDDCLNVGKKLRVILAKNGVLNRFDFDETGNMYEYVGCKLEHYYYNMTLKFTQPVLLKHFGIKFNFPRGNTSKIPAPTGYIFMKVKTY